MDHLKSILVHPLAHPALFKSTQLTKEVVPAQSIDNDYSVDGRETNNCCIYVKFVKCLIIIKNLYIKNRLIWLGFSLM